MAETKAPKSWKGITTADEAIALIDFGVLLKWRDLRNLRREFKEGDEERVIRHLARCYVERSASRLQSEILVESLLIWLAHAAQESLLNAFLEEFFAQAGCDDACWPLVEIALTSELAEASHNTQIFEMAVALICELGLSLKEYEKAYPGEFARANALLDYIGTYLLSVSNANSICIRLSLLHYFGVYEHGQTKKQFINRVMGRFGHTVLEHLFVLLFRKRSEAVALQYLLENLPFVMEADHLAQKILHETFKSYMLKNPERFSLFMQAFSAELAGKEAGSYILGKKTFLQHIGAMLKVVSEVGHQQLARELFVCLLKFDGEPGYAETMAAIRADSDVRDHTQSILNQLLAERQHLNEPRGGRPLPSGVQPFRAVKRGRKPSFNRATSLGTMHQVTYLGSVDIQRAS